MRISYKTLQLDLKHDFNISRSSRSNVPVVVLALQKDDVAAFGEASPNARYNETVETVSALLGKIDTERLEEVWDPESLSAYLDTLSPHDPSAKAAVDIALHDWIGRKLGVPLYSYFGLKKPARMVSSFTIGIDTPEVVRQKVIEAGPYPILKVKLGASNDEEIIEAVRKITYKPIRVDANEGWKTKEEALKKINWLATQNVELVEQPMPADRLDDTRWLRERVDIPLVADEALDSAESLERIADAYDGINVKIQKIGGLYKSRRLIMKAKQLGLKVMLGCMIETTVGISAAAHLGALADWLDLDGNVLISNDPFTGAINKNGEIILTDEPGLGVAPAS